MKPTQPVTIWRRPLFRVIATWLSSFIGPFLLAILILTVLQTDLSTARKAYAEHPYLSSYFEILVAGLVPVVWTLAGRDDLSAYGLSRQGLARSLLLSALVIALSAGFSLLTTGRWINYETVDFGLRFPVNVWYGLLGVFAYGPLEVFFFVWLAHHTGQVFQSKNHHPFWGLLVTVGLFGLLHILATQNLGNALTVGVTFFLLGLIFTTTRNSIGPMLAWTLINGQVWFLAQMLWS
jgi:membrane protease YdiL (CAAX protease family)